MFLFAGAVFDCREDIEALVREIMKPTNNELILAAWDCSLSNVLVSLSMVDVKYLPAWILR